MKFSVGLLAAAGVLFASAVNAGPELVRFPTNYKSTFTFVTTRDQHLGGNSIVDIYANQVAVDSATGDGPLASGSFMLMEAYRAKVDDNGEPLLDENERFIKGEARGIVTMEKRAGWGTDYPPELRNGEWEYAIFTLEGEPRDRPTTSCFECHKALEDIDFVYTMFELAEIKN